MRTCLLTLLCSTAGMEELTSPSLATIVARVASHDMLLLFDGSDPSMTVLAFWMPARHTADTTSLLTAAAEEPPAASTCNSQHHRTPIETVHVSHDHDQRQADIYDAGQSQGAVPPQGVQWQGRQRGGRPSCGRCQRRPSAAGGRPAAAAPGPPAECVAPGTAAAWALPGSRRCLEHCHVPHHMCSVSSACL
jgi:hypothetical protein